jgi:hypothetical protein
LAQQRIQDRAEFARTLGNAALGVIRADMAPAQKENFFHQLLQQDFDTPGMARVCARTVLACLFAQYHGEPIRS